MTTNAEMLADRYGKRKSAGKGGRPTQNQVGIAIVAALALVGFVVWAWSSVSTKSADVTLVSSGSKPLSDTSFEVYGKVTRPAEGTVRCALRVQALNFAVVGYREIELAPGTTTFDTTVYSFAAAVSASVQSCWLQ